MTDAVSGNGSGPEVRDDPVKTAEQFLATIAAGDHRSMWEQFSEDARAFVINIALERGMDFDLGSRLRQGTASDEELDEYLQELLEGLKRDLRGVDFDALTFSEPEPVGHEEVKVTYLVEFEQTLVDEPMRMPAGSIMLRPEGGGWKVARIMPNPG